MINAMEPNQSWLTLNSPEGDQSKAKNNYPWRNTSLPLKFSMPDWLLTVLLMLFIFSDPATAQKKIYIITDLEGISGVYKFDQAWVKDTPLNLKACEYFMGDVAAVVRGLRDGGATEVVVCDGHGDQAVIPDLMIPGATYITGKPKPGPGALWGLDRSFAGFVMVGFHAMRGTPDGVLNHTQSVENRYWYNDVESGELAQNAAIAGYFGVPPIMATGDEATCREAKIFFGGNCITVAVKRGVSREAAVLYPLEETHKALYEGAKRAMAAISSCKPYILKTPIKAKMKYLSPDPTMEEYLAKKSIPDYWEPKLQTKEGTIEDALHLLDF
jgi:D-amino peptidase